MLQVKEKRENAKMTLEQIRKIKVGKTGYPPSIFEKEEWKETLGQTGIFTTSIATVETKREMLK